MMNFYNSTAIVHARFVKNYNNMKHYFITILTFLLVLSSCAQNTTTEANQYQSLLDAKAKKSTGVLMAVYAPDLNIDWQGASGYDSRKKDQKLQPDQPFRIASITKTFTAVSILRLAEMGKLDINDPISKYISKEHKALLQKDNYDIDKITVKHCLQHTSGLYDYAMGGDDYVAQAMKTPNKRWTRTEQVQFAMDYGDPVGKPGEVYHYSDTGYVLLGEIIETLTGKGLAAANRELINFKKLGLSHTWLESLEPAPKGIGKKAHAYLQDMDATEWDNSVDLYGGGGYAASTKDLAIFYYQLFNNGIFEKLETLKTLLSPNGITNQGRTAESYKMGLWEIRTPHGNGYMHDGFWGSSTIYFPKYKAAVALYYVDQYDNDLMKGAFVDIVKRSKKK